MISRKHQHLKTLKNTEGCEGKHLIFQPIFWYLPGQGSKETQGTHVWYLRLEGIPPSTQGTHGSNPPKK